MGVSAILKSCGNTYRLPGERFVTVIRDLEKTLSGEFETVQYLGDRAFEIAVSGFGKPASTRNRASTRDHLFGADATALLHKDDVVYGFASAKHHKELDLLYLHGVVVMDRVRGGKSLVEGILDQTRFRRMALTTQNPRVYSLMKHFCTTIYPSPDAPTVPREIAQYAQDLKIRDSARLDTSTFVMHGAYPSCLYPQIPQNRDARINDWFGQALDIRDGLSCDAFLLIGER